MKSNRLVPASTRPINGECNPATQAAIPTETASTNQMPLPSRKPTRSVTNFARPGAL